MEDNSQVLHKKLYDNGLYTKSYDEFKEQWLSSDDKINELFTTLSTKGHYTKSFDDFSTQYSLKKKYLHLSNLLKRAKLFYKSLVSR